MIKLQYPHWLCIFALILLFAISIFIRHQDFDNTTGSRNLEASYHVLLTVTALNESPVARHWFLPTVSLGRELDKNIPWGATIPTASGDYIYTSFTPPGFLAPYVWLKSFGLEPSIKNLAYFNSVIGLFCGLLLFVVTCSLLEIRGHGNWVSASAALIACTISVFSREALSSHGIVYWVHSLSQLIVIATICLFFKYLTCDRNKHIYGFLLVFMAFLGGFTEWSGYIFNAGLIFIFFLLEKKENSKKIAIYIFSSTLLSVIVTVMYYGFAIGFKAALLAFVRRFSARSGATGSLVELLQGYALSFGLFLVVLFALLVLKAFFLTKFGNRKSNAEVNADNLTKLIILAAVIPLLENLIMMQHATEFSFDRLKFIIPAVPLMGMVFAELGIKGRLIFTVFMLTSCIHGFSSYRSDLKNYSEWLSIDAKNHELAKKVLAQDSPECSVYSENIGTRGYANFLFHRGIYEYKTAGDANEIRMLRKACKEIHLEARTAFKDLPRFERFIVTGPDGHVETISNEETK